MNSEAQTERGNEMADPSEFMTTAKVKDEMNGFMDSVEKPAERTRDKQ